MHHEHAIRCPRCGRRIADIQANQPTQEFLLTDRCHEYWHISMKCPACKAQIGVNIPLEDLLHSQMACRLSGL